MNYDDIARLTTSALMLCLLVSLPAVAVSALAGLLISFLQAITSLQDSSISHGLKLIIVSVVIVVAAPWGAASILQFGNTIMQTLFQQVSP